MVVSVAMSEGLQVDALSVEQLAPGRQTQQLSALQAEIVFRQSAASGMHALGAWVRSKSDMQGLAFYNPHCTTSRGVKSAKCSHMQAPAQPAARVARA